MKIQSSPTLFLIAFLVFAALINFSCKKELSQALTPQEEEQANVTSTESEAEAEDVFNGIFDDAMGVNNDVGLAGTGIFARSAISNGSGDVARIDPAPPCLIITHTATTSFPVTYTLDFGNSGCTCADGHVRRGKIIATYTGRLTTTVGASVTLHFQDFFIDSIHVENTTTQVVTNTSSLISSTIIDTLIYTIDVHAKLTKTNGNYSEWQSHRIISRISANVTASLQDYFKVEGSASGRVKRNDLLIGWRSEIIEPLLKRFICRWISKGRVRILRETLSPTSQWVGILNYGPGTCDRDATLEVNNHTYNITLH
jgi:predicted secreted Zn-dependent protease